MTATLRAAALAIALRSAAAFAGDVWTQPYPGIALLHRTTAAPLDVWVATIDTCAPGVRLQVSSPAEGNRTTSAFAALVGAQLATNGDFADHDFGLNVGSFVSWGSPDTDHSGNFAFGRGGISVYPTQAILPAPEPWMGDVLGGRWSLIDEGVADYGIDDNGPSPGGFVCAPGLFHPRTAIGLSRDGRKLFMLVADGRQAHSRGMTCDELIDLFRALGAHWAMGLDGGGSSTMVLQGQGVINRPSDATGQRTLKSFLGVHATGVGPAPQCPATATTGAVEVASCDVVSGWAQSPVAPTTAARVRLVEGGLSGEAGTREVSTEAGLARADLCATLGSCAHGFRQLFPRPWQNGQPHALRVYGVHGGAPGRPRVLEQGTQVLSCPTPPARGLKRQLLDLQTFAGWKFDIAVDLLTVDDAALAALPLGPALPTAPTLQRAGADTYWVEGSVRHLVTSAQTLQDWRLLGVAVAQVSQAQLDALTLGPPLTARPELVKGSGPAIYLLEPEATAPVRVAAASSGRVEPLAAPSRFTPLPPTRALDTRGGARPAAGSSTAVPLTLAGDATAAWLSVTAVDSTGAGFLTVARPGEARPESSNVNFGAGQVASNAAVAAPVGGAISVFASAPSHVVVDVLGSFGPQGLGFEPLPGRRLLDTRATGQPLQAGVVRAVPLAGTGAALVNLTVVDPAGPGFLSVLRCGGAAPGTSNLNFAAGQVISALAAAPLEGGALCVRSSQDTHLVVDEAGRFDAAAPGRFVPSRAFRLLDTRRSDTPWTGRLEAQQPIDLSARSIAGMPANVSALVFNATVVGADGPGYLTLSACGSGAGTSSVNFPAQAPAANLVVTALDSAGSLCATTSTRAHLILDLQGYFVPPPPVPQPDAGPQVELPDGGLVPPPDAGASEQDSGVSLSSDAGATPGAGAVGGVQGMSGGCGCTTGSRPGALLLLAMLLRRRRDDAAA